MRFAKYGHYMHEDCMDVCIVVLRTQYRDSKRYKLKVEWLNLGYTGNFWPVSSEQTITIKTEDVHKWRHISSRINNVRTRPGLPEEAR